MVDGLPLALRCIGYRLAVLPSLPIAELADQLARSPLEVLHIGNLDVRAAYDSSYGELTRLEQGVFRLLSAGELLGWEDSAVRRILTRLAEAHLITIAPGCDQYQFPRLTLTYAREQLSWTLMSASEFGAVEWEPVGSAS